MIVRELIVSLLDYDMDATVEILVESKEDSFDTNEFEIAESKFSSGAYLTIKVVPDGHEVVEESTYSDMKDEILNLKSIREDLSSEVEELQRDIYELEQQK